MASAVPPASGRGASAPPSSPPAPAGIWFVCCAVMGLAAGFFTAELLTAPLAILTIALLGVIGRRHRRGAVTLLALAIGYEAIVGPALGTKLGDAGSPGVTALLAGLLAAGPVLAAPALWRLCVTARVLMTPTP